MFCQFLIPQNQNRCVANHSLHLSLTSIGHTLPGSSMVLPYNKAVAKDKISYQDKIDNLLAINIMQ